MMPRGCDESRPAEQRKGISQLHGAAGAPGECSRFEVPRGTGKLVCTALGTCQSLPSLQHWETFPVANSQV